MKRLSFLLLIIVSGCGLAVSPTGEKDVCFYVREQVANGSITEKDAYYWWSDCAPFPPVASNRASGDN